MTVDATLLLIAPEMASVSLATRAGIANLAALSVGSVYADKQELAIAYLAAHMLTMSLRAGVGGAVKSMKEGDLSLAYGGSDSESGYAATSYGNEFMRLQRETIFAARTRSV